MASSRKRQSIIQGSLLQGSSIIQQTPCRQLSETSRNALAVFVGLLPRPNHTLNLSSNHPSQMAHFVSLTSTDQKKRGELVEGRGVSTFKARARQTTASVTVMSLTVTHQNLTEGFMVGTPKHMLMVTYQSIGGTWWLNW